MFKLFLRGLVWANLSFGLIYPGVLLLSDLPEAVNLIVDRYQDGLAQAIANSGESLIFEKAKFSPHLTLAFITADQIGLTDVLAKYPKLSEKLTLIADKNQSIAVGDSFLQAHLELWRGKFEFNIGGAKRKNYINIVLKLSHNQELSELAKQAMDLLENEYGIKQSFAFSPHLTLGRVCLQDDQILDDQLIESLKTKLAVIIDDQQLSIDNLILNSFDLVGHDQAKINYSLGVVRAL